MGGRDWIDPARDRDRWQAFVSGNVRLGSIKFGEFLD